jgi:hypothetical protein
MIRKIWLLPFLLGLTCGPARAFDMARIVQGRTTYAKGASVMNLSYDQASPRWSDTTKDTVQSEVEVEHAFTDRLDLSVDAQTQEARRNQLHADRFSLESDYRILDAPFQAAPRIGIAPSIRGDGLQFEVGSTQLKNFDEWTLMLDYEAEFAQTPGRTSFAILQHQFETGVFYRFSLRGLTGTTWEYDTKGESQAALVLGGSISKNVFLGIKQQFPLNRKTPSSESNLLLSFYFGPAALAGWGF